MNSSQIIYLTVIGAILVISFWLSLGVFVIRLGGRRQIGSRLTAVITFFFSPIIGLFFVALSGKKEVERIDYYGELLKLNELHKNGLVNDGELEIEKRKIQQRRDSEEEIEPDYSGVKYYLWTSIITIVIVLSINGTAGYLLFNENQTTQEVLETESETLESNSNTDPRNNTKNTTTEDEKVSDSTPVSDKEKFSDFYRNFMTDFDFQVSRYAFNDGTDWTATEMEEEDAIKRPIENVNQVCEAYANSKSDKITLKFNSTSNLNSFKTEKYERRNGKWFIIFYGVE